MNRREVLAGLLGGLLLPRRGSLDRDRISGDPTLNQRLGYPADARLILLNADDLGLLQSINAAAIMAFEAGALVSGSVMVPSPWFPEIAAHARTHPTFDLGVHLTLISERPSFRLSPVLGAPAVPSLVDGNGFFPEFWEPDRKVDLKELEAECRAQLERARELGVFATHLDAHGHAMQWGGEEVFGLMLRLSAEYRLPVRVGRNWFPQYGYLPRMLGRDGVVLDRTITIPPTVPPARWTAWYVDTIHSLAPGVTEIFLHPGYDNGELRAFAPPRLSYGAAWRQRDLDALVSPAVQAALKQPNTFLHTWRDLRRLLPDRDATAESPS